MLPEEKEHFIKQKAKEHRLQIGDKIAWSLHAIKKLRSEGLKKLWVEKALTVCIMVEDYYMEGRPMPGCLVLGRYNSIPMHIVIAIDRDNDRIFIITVYKPLKERWINGWKTRKTKK